MTGPFLSFFTTATRKLDILQQKQNLIFICSCTLFALITITRIFTANYFFFDTAEHIHASWLVSIGKIPYRDFFEHHNPLLWFCLAPLTQLFERKICLIFIVRFVAVISWAACLAVIYKISRKFLYDKQKAQLSVLILLSIPSIWADAINIRPDTFMLLSFLMAVYFLYNYLGGAGRASLAISYICLSLSFLFLQKMLFLGMGFAIANLLLWQQKKIKTADICLAALYALIPLIIFLFYLIDNDCLHTWFYYNFPFNTQLKSFYKSYTSGLSARLGTFTALSLLVLARWFRPTWQTLIICCCGISALMMVKFFAPHPWYYVPYWVFASILLAGIIGKSKYFSLWFAIILYCFLNTSAALLPKQHNILFAQTLQNIKDIMEHSSKQDTVLNLKKGTIHLFNHDAFYHWFGFHNVAICDAIYNRKQYFDINTAIKSAKPDIIIFDGNSFFPIAHDVVMTQRENYRIARNQHIIQKARTFPAILSKISYPQDDFWKVDKKWIKQHYQKIENTDIWKKRPVPGT